MLDAPAPEVSVSRRPFAATSVAVLLALGLAACDDGDSKDADRPRRTTTSTPSSSSSSSSSTSTTAASVPPGGGSGIPDQPNVPTTIPPATVGSCGNQTDALVAAINGSEIGSLDARQGQFTIQQCRIAASSPIWAAAAVVPNPGVQLARSTVVLQRIGALWNVEEVGTSNVGCRAPAPVRFDLGLTCPG